MLKKKKNILSLFVCFGALSANAAHMPIDSLYGISTMSELRNLSVDKLNLLAYKTESNSLKINDDNAIRNSLSNINQKQIINNILMIENMQSNSGSGIYFSQSIQNHNNFQNKNNDLDIQSYQNTLGGKFSLNAESSIMATVNEGKSSLEKFSLINGLEGESETKSLGLSLAYNKKISGNQDIFAFMGKNWVENDFNSLGQRDGNQIHLGVGAKYTNWSKEVSFTPQINIQKLKSSMKNSQLKNLPGDTTQTVATIGVKTNYRVNNYFTLGASVNYEKDLSVSGDIQQNNTNKENFTQVANLSDERIGFGVSLVYQPMEKMNLVMDFKHKVNNGGSDKAINVGVRYNF